MTQTHTEQIGTETSVPLVGEEDPSLETHGQPETKQPTQIADEIESTELAERVLRKNPPRLPAGLPATYEHFGEIYEAYKTPIYNYIFHLVGNAEEAADLTQDTFFKAARTMSKMKDPVAALSAWLYRIATNTAYDALRRRKLIHWEPLPEECMPSTKSTYGTISQDGEATEKIVKISGDFTEDIANGEAVRTALRRMPRGYKVALWLYYQEGYTYKELARVLTIAESGVKMYLSRARKSFRFHYRALDNAA